MPSYASVAAALIDDAGHPTALVSLTFHSDVGAGIQHGSRAVT